MAAIERVIHQCSKENKQRLGILYGGLMDALAGAERRSDLERPLLRKPKQRQVSIEARCKLTLPRVKPEQRRRVGRDARHRLGQGEIGESCSVGYAGIQKMTGARKVGRACQCNLSRGEHFESTVVIKPRRKATE